MTRIVGEKMYQVGGMILIQSKEQQQCGYGITAINNIGDIHLTSLSITSYGVLSMMVSVVSVNYDQ